MTPREWDIDDAVDEFVKSLGQYVGAELARDPISVGFRMSDVKMRLKILIARMRA